VDTLTRAKQFQRVQFPPAFSLPEKRFQLDSHATSNRQFCYIGDNLAEARKYPHSEPRCFQKELPNRRECRTSHWVHVHVADRDETQFVKLRCIESCKESKQKARYWNEFERQ